VGLAIAKYHQNTSNGEKSMKFGMVVGIGHRKKTRVAAKVKHA